MKHLKRAIAFLMLVPFAGCATLPAGPTVRVMPTSGKPFDKFQIEDATCRQWAAQQIGMTPQEIANQRTFSGAAVGTVIGAGIGLLLGSATRQPGAGAAVGAGTGLLIGSAIGSDEGRVYGYEAQRRYDNAYAQCMYSYGNQVQSPVQLYKRHRVIVVPPPADSYPPPAIAPVYPPPPPLQPPPPPETPPPGEMPPDAVPVER